MRPIDVHDEKGSALIYEKLEALGKKPHLGNSVATQKTLLEEFKSEKRNEGYLPNKIVMAESANKRQFERLWQAKKIVLYYIQEELCLKITKKVSF